MSIERKEIRKSIVRMMNYSKSSHIGSCLSIVDILYTLYFRVMDVDPENPRKEDRDRFILSKAHASAALYATLAHRGFFPLEYLDKYYIDGGILPGHLDREAVPGVEASAGSLGHGLPLGLGMALANRVDKNPGRVFVIVGDGECNEGSIWEAVMLAGSMKLTNLTVIVDYNKIQSFGMTNDIINQANLPDRFADFGWETHTVNGHNVDDLVKALEAPQKGAKAIIADTVKGKSVSFMENQLAWHYKSPDAEQLKKAILEIDGGDHA